MPWREIYMVVNHTHITVGQNTQPLQNVITKLFIERNKEGVEW